MEAAVSDYIPSFQREWSVIEPNPDEGAVASEIDYNSFLTGKTTTLKCEAVQGRAGAGRGGRGRAGRLRLLSQSHFTHSVSPDDTSDW